MVLSSFRMTIMKFYMEEWVGVRSGLCVCVWWWGVG